MIRDLTNLRRLATVLGTAATALLVAAPAAASASKWTQITHEGNGAKFNLGLGRTGDGTLHVLWAGPGRIPYTAIFDTPISPSGALGQSQTVIAGWAGVHAPAAVVAPDGSVHALVSGGEKYVFGNPHIGINELTGPGSWTVGTQAYGKGSDNADVRADILPNGQIVTVWQTGVSDLMVVGTDPGTQPQDLRAGGVGVFGAPDVGVDRATGTAFIVYSESGFDWFRPVFPAIQTPVKIPVAAAPGHVPAVAPRLGGGLYTTVIPPGFMQVELVRLGGSPQPLPVPHATQVVSDGVVAGPEGRMWLFFGNQKDTFVTRTNKAVTRYEPLRRIRNPAGVAQYFRIEGEGSRGQLDLFTNLTIDGSTKDGTYATHVLPQLSLKLTRKASKITALVTDASDPVPGAKVSGLPGGLKTTGANGKATFKTGPGGHFTATAAKADYLSAKAHV